MTNNQEPKVVYAQPVTSNVNPFFGFIKRCYNGFKTVAYLAVLGLAFYGGMFVMMDHNDRTADSKETLIAALTEAVGDTSDEVIVQIVPRKSLLEHVKYSTFWNEPQRKVVTITNDKAVQILFGENNHPSAIAALWGDTKDLSGKAWNGVKEGADWCWKVISFQKLSDDKK